MKYAGVLEDYLKKSYVRKVTTEEVELCGNNQWFLPHFPVRISEIQQNSEPANWHHVPGKINPADLPSRGVAAQQLVDEDAW